MVGTDKRKREKKFNWDWFYVPLYGSVNKKSTVKKNRKLHIITTFNIIKTLKNRNTKWPMMKDKEERVQKNNQDKVFKNVEEYQKWNIKYKLVLKINILIYNKNGEYFI